MIYDMIMIWFDYDSWRVQHHTFSLLYYLYIYIYHVTMCNSQSSYMSQYEYSVLYILTRVESLTTQDS